MTVSSIAAGAWGAATRKNIRCRSGTRSRPASRQNGNGLFANNLNGNL